MRARACVRVRGCMRACRERVCVRACVRVCACVRASECACIIMCGRVRACGRACVRTCGFLFSLLLLQIIDFDSLSCLSPFPKAVDHHVNYDVSASVWLRGCPWR